MTLFTWKMFLLYFSLEEEDSLNRQDVTVDNQNNVEGQGEAFIYIFSFGKSLLTSKEDPDRE
jgi:hypothetical protein